MSRYAKSAHEIFPYEVMNFLGSYFDNWFSFDPLGEVFDGNDQVLHLAYGQKERFENVNLPCVESPWAGDRA